MKYTVEHVKDKENNLNMWWQNIRKPNPNLVFVEHVKELLFV